MVLVKVNRWVAVVQLLSRVRFFASPWTAACQTSLSFTISQSLLKLMSIESMMPSNHLVLCHPLLLLPLIWVVHSSYLTIFLYIWVSLVAQLVKNLPAMQETLVWFLGRVDPLEKGWRRDRLPTPVFLGFPCSSAVKESTCNVGDLGSTPGWEDPLEKGKATPSSILAWRIPCTL